MKSNFEIQWWKIKRTSDIFYELIFCFFLEKHFSKVINDPSEGTE